MSPVPALAIVHDNSGHADSPVADAYQTRFNLERDHRVLDPDTGGLLERDHRVDPTGAFESR